MQKYRGSASILFNTLFNLHKFIAYEHRDPFTIRAEQECSMADWDRFAAQEYDILAAEEEQEESLRDGASALTSISFLLHRYVQKSKLWMSQMHLAMDSDEGEQLSVVSSHVFHSFCCCCCDGRVCLFAAAGFMVYGWFMMRKTHACKHARSPASISLFIRTARVSSIQRGELTDKVKEQSISKVSVYPTKVPPPPPIHVRSFVRSECVRAAVSCVRSRSECVCAPNPCVRSF